MKFKLVLVGLFLVTLLPRTTFAFSEDFESYSLGSIPAVWGPAANALSDPARNVIALDPTDPSNKVLQLFGSLTSIWAATASHAYTFPDSWVLNFDVYNGAEVLGGHLVRGYVYLRNAPSCCPPSRLLIGYRGDGSVISSNSSSIPLPSYVTEEWYHVQIAYNRVGSDLTVDYYIDGVFVGTQYESVSESFEASLNHLNLVAQGGTALFDNISIRAGSVGDLEFTAPRTAAAPNIDGVVGFSEWSAANSFSLDLVNYLGETQPAIWYFMNDGSYLYIGVQTQTTAHWDTHAGFAIDGNNDDYGSGSIVAPHQDFTVGQRSVIGWSGHAYFGPS